MAEFVNLNSEDTLNVNPILKQTYSTVEDTEVTSLNINPIDKTSIKNITPTTEVIGDFVDVEEVSYTNEEKKNLIVPVEEVYSIDLLPGQTLPEEEECCIQSCDPSKFYGDPNPDDSFKRANLFSELVDEYQRAMARYNLGITDEYSLVWGNIKGNIANQSDIYNFIVNSIASNINEVLNGANSKLAEWAYEIRTTLEGKADKESPNLTGEPTTSLPSIYDNSNRIASTEWVNAKIAEITNAELLYLSLNKNFIFYGDPMTDVTCAWDFSVVIESQSINGTELPIDTRSYTFTGISNSFPITLSYVYNGKTYSKSVTLKKVYPTYYGVILNYVQLNKTGDNSVVITCNENDYGYLYIPNGKDSRISVDGLVGGFKTIGTSQIHGITYYIYRTSYSGLGKLNINIL